MLPLQLKLEDCWTVPPIRRGKTRRHKQLYACFYNLCFSATQLGYDPMIFSTPVWDRFLPEIDSIVEGESCLLIIFVSWEKRYQTPDYYYFLLRVNNGIVVRMTLSETPILFKAINWDIFWNSERKGIISIKG